MTRSRAFLILLTLSLSPAAFRLADHDAAASLAPPSIRLQPIVTGLDSPVHLTHPLGPGIAEFHVSGDAPNVADATERVLLEIPQPFRNHNGGLNLFGPDGMLYIGMGDGGSGGDPLNKS